MSYGRSEHEIKLVMQRAALKEKSIITIQALHVTAFKTRKIIKYKSEKARQLCYNDHKLVDSNIKYKVTTAFADSERQVTDYFLGEEKYVFRDQRLEKIIWHSRKQDGSAERN